MKTIPGLKKMFVTVKDGEVTIKQLEGNYDFQTVQIKIPLELWAYVSASIEEEIQNPTPEPVEPVEA